MSERASCGCHCGAIRFTVPAGIETFIACHCDSCRKVSGGAAAYLVPVPLAEFDGVRDRAGHHTVTGSSGKPVTRYFCPDCGTPLWSEPEAFAGTAFLKAGAYDTDPGLTLGRAVHTASAPEWHVIPEGIPTRP